MHNHLFTNLDSTEKVEAVDYIIDNLSVDNKLSKNQILTTLNVPKSTYNSIRNHVPSKSEIIRSKVKDEIYSIYTKYKGIYGAPKIHNELISKTEHKNVSVRTVSIYMRQLSIRSITNPKFKSVSKSEQQLPFNIPLVNYLKYSRPTSKHTHILTDITYIYTKKEGWCYLLTFMDLYTRKILAWDLNTDMTANWICSIVKKLISTYKNIAYIHSDRGSQYTSKEYLKLLLTNGISPSFSAKGYPYHNAWIESFHAQLKKESIYRRILLTFDEAKTCCFNYIEGFYNTVRIQKVLGYLSPNKFESEQNINKSICKMKQLIKDQEYQLKFVS